MEICAEFRCRIEDGVLFRHRMAASRIADLYAKQFPIMTRVSRHFYYLRVFSTKTIILRFITFAGIDKLIFLYRDILLKNRDKLVLKDENV